MATQSMPNYWVRIEPFHSHPDYIRVSPNYVRRPARTLGANILDPHQYLPQDYAWRFQGTAYDNLRRPQYQGLLTTPLPLPTHCDPARPIQCYSVYVGSHDIIYMVNYNAVTTQVWNGEDRVGRAVGSQRNWREDWQPLRFNPHNNNSYALFSGVQECLPILRQGHPCLEQLLPQHNRNADQLLRSDRRGAGGLTGDTSLLLGLLALSIPNDLVPTELPGRVQTRWQCAQYPVQQSRRPGRAVVVKLWLDLPVMPANVTPERRVMYEAAILRIVGMFRQYQNGEMGMPFP